jgi:hypothetical protein
MMDFLNEADQIIDQAKYNLLSKIMDEDFDDDFDLRKLLDR